MFCRVEGESGDVIGFSRVADETSGCVGVKGYHEEECLGLASINVGIVGEGETYEMMGIPESFKALFANGLMCSSVHQEHDQ
jgi:hypothetical protein